MGGYMKDIIVNWVKEDEELLESYEWDESDDLEIIQMCIRDSDGSVKGEVEYVDGIKGKAIHIVNSNGSTSQVANQYVDFGKNIRFNNNDFAISFWYKSDNGCLLYTSRCV